MTHQQIETRLRTFAHDNKLGNHYDVYFHIDGHEVKIKHIYLDVYPDDLGFFLEAEGIEYWPAGNPDEFERIETMEVSQ